MGQVVVGHTSLVRAVARLLEELGAASPGATASDDTGATAAGTKAMWALAKPAPFEHNVKYRTRFFVDNNMSCGCWLLVQFWHTAHRAHHPIARAH